MYPNPGQYLTTSRQQPPGPGGGGGATPPPHLPHHLHNHNHHHHHQLNHQHPAAMIKAAAASAALNNNYPNAMASPFFVDNLLHHQKAAAAVNFQSQFVNTQLHNYIQEQHHQFLVHQSQMRQHHQQQQQQQHEVIPEPIKAKNYSRNNSPLSEEASPRNEYEDDDENFTEDTEKTCFRRPKKDDDTRKARKQSPITKDYEENSRSPIDDQDRFTEDSPSGSPVNVRLQSSIKNEFQLSPTNYSSNYYGEKKDEAQIRSGYGKDEPQEDQEIHGEDHEIARKKSPCSNCGSFECSPFYPTCRNYGSRRYEGVYSDIKNGVDVNSGESVVGVADKDDRDKDKDVVKRCNTNLNSDAPVQKPILKFSVSAILGQDTGVSADRSASANVIKINHHDGFPGQVSGPGGVFALPLGGFSLAPIAKPIASRPPPYPPGAVAAPHPHHSLHSLLAHCRHHPYLAVGGVGGGGGGWGAAVGGGGFPWAGARGKPRRGMMRRAVFSDTQRRGLERRFQLQKYISKPDRKKLAEKLGLKDSQVKIWFQNRRMKWRNSKERELLASGGSREQTLPNKNNPHPDLSDAETDRPKLSPLSPQSTCENDPNINSENDQGKGQFEAAPPHHEADSTGYRGYLNAEGGIANPSGYMLGNNGVRSGGGKSYSLIAADDAMMEDYDSDNGSNSDEEINVT